MNPTASDKPVKRKSALAGLDDAQRKQLCEWLNSGQTYDETLKRVETDFGISGTTTSALKHFRKKHCTVDLPERPICPPGIPRDVWEASLAKMQEVLRDPDTKMELRVRVSAFLLQLLRLTLDSKRLKAKPRARKNPKGADVSLPAEENPLDDQDKLDEIRREVFGSAPE
jgi:hypothetical protein